MRLAGAPKKIAFLKNAMNIVDCAAILPYYITLFVMPQDNFGSIPPASATAAPSTTVRRLLQLDTNTEDSLLTTVEAAEEAEEGGFGNISRIMQVQSQAIMTTLPHSLFIPLLAPQVFRIARIMRIFKLARRSVGLQAMAHTVRTSWKDLGLLFMLVGMGMLVFGSLEYFIENEEPDTGFTSIPQVDC